MTTSRLSALQVVAVLLLGLFASPLLPCSVVTAEVGGPFWTGDHWLLSGRRWTGWGSHSMVYALDQQGELLWERDTGLGGDENPRVTLVGRTDADALWFSVSCTAGAHPDCGHFVRLEPDGTRSVRLPFPEDVEAVWIDGRGFVTARFEPDRRAPNGRAGVREGTPRLLRLYDLSESGEQSLAHDLELPPGVAWSRHARYPAWAMNASGEVALVAPGTDRTTVVFWRSGGKLGSVKTFPRAIPRTVPAEDQTPLGHPWSLHLSDQGELLLGSWVIHSDCSSDRKGWVLLNRDGDVITDSRETESSALLRNVFRGPDGQVALAGFDIEIFERTGARLRRFPSTPAQWDAEEERLGERAARLEEKDPVAEWIELLPHAQPDQARAIQGWIVDRWPDLTVEIPDALWRALARRLCERYPETAPAQALAEFEAAENARKAEWLSPLVQCFDAPPPGVMDYARDLAEGRVAGPNWGARAAFEAWGQPATEELWQRLFTETPGRSEAGIELVRNWSTTGRRFGEILRGPSSRERSLVRRIVLETLAIWSPSFGMPYDDAGREARRLLLEDAGSRAEDADRRVAVVGQLLLLGHGLIEPANEAAAIERLWQETREPTAEEETLPWLAVAASRSFERHPADANDPRRPTGLQILRVVPQDEVWEESFRIGAYGAGDPYVTLAVQLGEDAGLVLLERATEPGAETPVRQRLLSVVRSDPWILQPESWRRLLSADWLARASELYPLDALDAASRSFAVTSPQLVEDIQEAFRQRLLRQGDRDLRSIFALYTRGWGSPPLLRALQRDDVREVLSRTRVNVDRKTVSQWLWVIQETGAWPEIVPQLEELVRSGPADQRLRAARALSALRHPEALPVLVELGLHYPENMRPLARYGAAARRAVLEHLDHDEPAVRNTVRGVLRRLGPTPEELERFEAEVKAAYATGALPLTETLLALSDAGREIAPDLVAALNGGLRAGPMSAYAHSPELYLVLAQSVGAGDDTEPTAEAMRSLWATESPEGRAALRLLSERKRRPAHRATERSPLIASLRGADAQSTAEPSARGPTRQSVQSPY